MAHAAEKEATAKEHREEVEACIKRSSSAHEQDIVELKSRHEREIAGLTTRLADAEVRLEGPCLGACMRGSPVFWLTKAPFACSLHTCAVAYLVSLCAHGALEGGPSACAW